MGEYEYFDSRYHPCIYYIFELRQYLLKYINILLIKSNNWIYIAIVKVSNSFCVSSKTIIKMHHAIHLFLFDYQYCWSVHLQFSFLWDSSYTTICFFFNKNLFTFCFHYWLYFFCSIIDIELQIALLKLTTAIHYFLGSMESKNANQCHRHSILIFIIIHCYITVS